MLAKKTADIQDDLRIEPLLSYNARVYQLSCLHRGTCCCQPSSFATRSTSLGSFESLVVIWLAHLSAHTCNSHVRSQTPPGSDSRFTRITDDTDTHCGAARDCGFYRHHHSLPGKTDPFWRQKKQSRQLQQKQQQDLRSRWRTPTLTWS